MHRKGTSRGVAEVVSCDGVVLVMVQGTILFKAALSCAALVMMAAEELQRAVGRECGYCLFSTSWSALVMRGR